MSQALHSLEVDHVVAICEQGLRQLGYQSGAIYRVVPGWPEPSGTPGARTPAIERRTYLRRTPAFSGTVSNKTIDLSVQSDIQLACELSRPITIFRNADYTERVLVPLKGEGNIASSGGNLLGLLVLYRRTTTDLEPREEANLASLGQQISLALQNALAYQQLEYRRATANQILKTNHRI